MNTTEILLPYNYVVSHVNLTWNDLLFAVKHGLMTRKSAVEHAEYNINQEEEISQKVIDLAWEDSEEVIPLYLEELSKLEHNDSNSNQKFLFLLLNWIFEHREQFTDPLGMVETIYADFDYPEEITSFVRYMPSQYSLSNSMDLNLERLYHNWKMYLEDGKNKFSI